MKSSSAAGVRAPPRGGGQVFVSCAHSCFPSPLRVVVVVFARRSWPPLRSSHAACARRYQASPRPFTIPSGESAAAELRLPPTPRARGKSETRPPSPLFAISGDFSAAAAVWGIFGFSSNSEEHAYQLRNRGFKLWTGDWDVSVCRGVWLQPLLTWTKLLKIFAQ
jgi:hypothetical protein